MAASLLDLLAYVIVVTILIGGGIALGELIASGSGATILEVRDGRDLTWIILLIIGGGMLLSVPAFVLAMRVSGGRAPGKAALGLRVLRLDDGTAATFGGNVVRDVLVKWILFYWILGQCFIPWILDWLWPLWDDRRQALHDKITTTVVVRDAAPGGGSAQMPAPDPQRAFGA